MKKITILLFLFLFISCGVTETYLPEFDLVDQWTIHVPAAAGYNYYAVEKSGETSLLIFQRNNNNRIKLQQPFLTSPASGEYTIHLKASMISNDIKTIEIFL